MLDELVGVIETLQTRIGKHGNTLRQNETRTRAALIDPLLQALGWDVADPELVTPEYRVDVGWADYALRGSGNSPAAIVEAKRLGAFVENHLSQAVGYCIEQGIAYAAVTDGEHWQMYRTFEQFLWKRNVSLTCTLTIRRPHECALQLLLMWRPNLATSKAIQANEPVLVPVNVPADKPPVARMLSPRWRLLAMGGHPCWISARNKPVSAFNHMVPPMERKNNQIIGTE